MYDWLVVTYYKVANIWKPASLTEAFFYSILCVQQGIYLNLELLQKSVAIGAAAPEYVKIDKT